MALTDRRQVWVWGDNTEGQLGVPTPNPCLTPVAMQAFPDPAQVMYIVAGGEHSLAAVHQMGDANVEQIKHLWPDCRGSSVAAVPSPSLAEGFREQNDYPRKVNCAFTRVDSHIQFCIISYVLVNQDPSHQAACFALRTRDKCCIVCPAYFVASLHSILLPAVIAKSAVGLSPASRMPATLFKGSAACFLTFILIVDA